MLQGSALAAFPARSQRYVPRYPPCHLPGHPRRAGSSLSCAFPLRSYARHQQAINQACGTPAWVTASVPLLFSLAAEESCTYGSKEGRGACAGWAGRQHQHLGREAIDNKDRQPAAREPTEPTDRYVLLVPRPARFQVCSIPSSRLDRPCLGALAQPWDWIVHQRVVSSPSAWTPTLNFPIRTCHNLPCHHPLRIYATVSPRQTRYLFCPSPEPLSFRSQSAPPPPSTRAGIRDDLYSHLRVACADGPPAGWVPIPVSTLAHQPHPGRFPYLPFPVSRIKTRGDPVADPSSGPSLLLLIPSFSLPRLLSNGSFLRSLPLHILFYFTPLL